MINSSGPHPVLNVAALSKNYGAKRAVDSVSLHVQRGEIVGLLGPNGAGKTSIISMVLGVLRPDSGDIHVESINMLTYRSQALAKTNFTAVYAPLPGNLTVYQNLKIFGLLYNVPNLEDRIRDLIVEFNLTDFRNAKCGALSSGEQTRICLAKAMLNKPQLLLLDEPTASLDPATARTIRAGIRNFAKESGGAVLWTSHNMAEVEDMCDRVLLVSKGKILLEGNPRTLPLQYGEKNLEDLFIKVAQEPLSFTDGAAA